MKRTRTARRTEMNIRLGKRTIERYEKYHQEGDFARIAELVTPPTTKVTVGKYMNAAADDPDTAMPLSIAKAAQAYYKAKEKEETEAAA